MLCERACLVETEHRYPNSTAPAKRLTHDRFADRLAAHDHFQRLTDDLARQLIEPRTHGRSEPNFNIGPKVVLSARVDAPDYADRNIDTPARMHQRQRYSFVRKLTRTKHVHNLQVRAIANQKGPSSAI